MVGCYQSVFSGRVQMGIAINAQVKHMLTVDKDGQ